MVTIAEIAQKLGLSTATVSNALTGKGRISEARRGEIVEAARQMGYDFSRLRAVMPNQKNICVIDEQIGVTFCDRIVQGICSAAEDAGLHVTIINLNILTATNWTFNNPSPELLRRYMHDVSSRIDTSYMGVIYVSQYPRDMTDQLPRLSMPLICTYAYTTDGIPCINYDDQHGAFLATSHLSSLGRRRLAMISGAVDSIPMTKRFAGYQRALVHAGLHFRPEYVALGNWNENGGYYAMKQLLALPDRPDGVFCQSDYLAIGAMRAVHEAGLRVPEDIAIVGFDDIDAAIMVDPRLTTIAPPHVEIGQEAVKKLLRVIENKDDGNNSVKLKCWLLKRDSA